MSDWRDWEVRPRDAEFVAGSDLDEIVVGVRGDFWLHLEQMDENHYWLRVGDQVLLIQRDADGMGGVKVVHEVLGDLPPCR